MQLVDSPHYHRTITALTKGDIPGVSIFCISTHISAKINLVTPLFMTKFYLLIATVAFFDLMAILAGKMSLITGKSFYIALCAIGFGIAGYFFALTLKYEDVAIVNVLWIALSIILVALMGHFFFKEHLSSTNILGMAVVMLGVVILNLR